MSWAGHSISPISSLCIEFLTSWPSPPGRTGHFSDFFIMQRILHFLTLPSWADSHFSDFFIMQRILHFLTPPPSLCVCAKLALEPGPTECVQFKANVFSLSLNWMCSVETRRLHWGRASRVGGAACTNPTIKIEAHTQMISLKISKMLTFKQKMSAVLMCHASVFKHNNSLTKLIAASKQ